MISTNLTSSQPTKNQSKICGFKACIYTCMCIYICVYIHVCACLRYVIYVY